MNGEKVVLSIIIASWNTEKYLAGCLRSLFEQKTSFNFEVIVVDNASKDKTVGMVMNQFSQVKLVANDKNLGFAKANNQGLETAQGEFILLLNPDTIVLPDTLEKTVKYLQENKEIGVLGCKLLDEDKTIQPSVRRFPTLKSQILILLKLHYLFPKAKSLQNYFAADFDYNKIQEADQIMGAFMLIRKEVISEFGLFDERFYVWFEEVDFCRRIKESKKWKIVYYPEAEIIHLGGKSFAQEFKLINQIRFNNSLLDYFRKYKNWGAVVLIILVYPLSLILALFSTFFRKEKKVKVEKGPAEVDISKFKIK